MKRHSLFPAVILACGIASCSSSTSSNPGSNNTTIATGMTATINGAAFSGQVVGFRNGGTLKNCQFEGFTQTPFQQIPIGLSPTITTTGTYPFANNPDGTTNVASIIYNISTASYSHLVAGSITVTTFTATNIQGTFDCKLVSGGKGDTVTITNGKFNVPLQ